MSSSKHPPESQATVRGPDDLDRDPGISASRGATRAGGLTGSPENPEDLSGANTSEGDVMNDVDPAGGVDPDQRGRTNR